MRQLRVSVRAAYLSNHQLLEFTDVVDVSREQLLGLAGVSDASKRQVSRAHDERLAREKELIATAVDLGEKRESEKVRSVPVNGSELAEEGETKTANASPLASPKPHE